MNLIFLGPPGAGKGTQARLMATRMKLPQISTGDILREAIGAETSLGQEAQRYVSRGELVPDAVMIGIVAERLQQADARRGFILDGFPRTIAQAEALDAVLARLDRRLDRVVYFEASEATLIHRLAGRRVCRAEGHIYNIDSNPPRTAGICDVDGSPLYARDDDKPETVRRRLAVYREQTEPLLAFYAARGLFMTINAESDVEETYEALAAIVTSQVHP
jgi:adenylate kinase